MCADLQGRIRRASPVFQDKTLRKWVCGVAFHFLSCPAWRRLRGPTNEKSGGIKSPAHAAGSGQTS